MGADGTNRGCELTFLSVGAGPIHGTLGRALVRGALSLAASRSYRDHSTKEYLERIGFRTEGDPVIPDLASACRSRRRPTRAAETSAPPQSVSA